MRSRLALLLAFLAILLAVSRGTSSTQSGAEYLRVVDGDTLQIEGAIVQLYGIDAPELGQLCESNSRFWPCGVDAALALDKLLNLNRSLLHCTPWSRDGAGASDPTWDAAPQVCKVGDQDLAVLMLRGGYSVALPQAFPDYLDAERQAKDAKLGIWHSDFVAPWDWRASVQSASRQSDALRACNVKGAFSPDGLRLYYVPTDPEYAAISIDSQRGGTIFCSDDEASQAGWRHVGEKAGE